MARDAGLGMLGSGCWAWDVGLRLGMLDRDVGLGMLGVGCWALDAGLDSRLKWA